MLSQLLLWVRLALLRGPQFMDSFGNPELCKVCEIPIGFQIPEILRRQMYMLTENAILFFFCLLNTLVRRKIKNIFHLLPPNLAFLFPYPQGKQNQSLTLSRHPTATESSRARLPGLVSWLIYLLILGAWAELSNSSGPGLSYLQRGERLAA